MLFLKTVKTVKIRSYEVGSFSITLFFASWAQRDPVGRCKMVLDSGPCSSECG